MAELVRVELTDEASAAAVAARCAAAPAVAVGWRLKDSGLGREGVRYAMEDFTEPKTLVIKSS